MRLVSSRVVVPVLVCLAATAAGPTAGDRWAHLHAARSAPAEALDGQRFGLELAWRHDLGPSYSSIAVADGRAVTMFSDGQSDHLVALDVKTGRQRWRHRIGPTYRGHDGSHDGPPSSPVIADSHVYALGAQGQLLALRLEDGREIWRTDVVQSLGAREPFYGFATTPAIVGDVLVIATGGEETGSFCAVDRGDGTKRWCAGEGPIDYQSVAPLELAGRSVVVGVTGTRLVGLSPRDGRLLWNVEHGRSRAAHSVTPLAIDGDRFLVAFRDEVTLYDVARDGETWSLTESLKTGGLSSEYAPPHLVDGHLYGFNNGILHCVDAKTGERRWRSRPPGGRGMIGVGGHLIVLGQGGEVVVVEASPEAYREKGRVAALEGAGWTQPAFADGRIFVRDLEGVAAVRLSSGSAGRADAGRAQHQFAKFVREVEAAENPAARVTRFLEQQRTFPIVEADRWVHFVYVGDAQDVAVRGSMLDVRWGRMEQVPGTRLFHRSFRIEPGARWEYRYQVDFEDEVTDPRNPRRVPGEGGDFSEVVTSGYRRPAFLDRDPRRRGRLEEFTFASESLDLSRDVKVYLPPGYDDAESRYPLLLVEDGERRLEHAAMARVLDNLAGERFEPVVAVFLGHPRNLTWSETQGRGAQAWATALATELVPQLEGAFRLREGTDSRALLAHGDTATGAVLAFLDHPDVFGGLAVQSLWPSSNWMDRIEEGLRQPRPGARLYVDWNRYDARSRDSGYDLADDGRALTEMARQAGYHVAGGEALDTYGWTSFASRGGDAIGALFPPAR